VAGVILIVGVGVDDHVGARRETSIEPGEEGRGEALIPGEAYDVVDTALARDPRRVIVTAVVDDEPLYRVKPRHLAWQRRERDAERASLVETRDLDDELHGRPSRGAALHPTTWPEH